MRRKAKVATSTDWRLFIQTIHTMIFLVYCFVPTVPYRTDSTHEDNTVKIFNRPLIYKDMLLSAVFSDSIDSTSRKRINLSFSWLLGLPLWLLNSLADGLFDCYYKCSLRIELPEDSTEFSSLSGDQSARYLLQAIIKPCPNHFVQINDEINSSHRINLQPKWTIFPPFLNRPILTHLLQKELLVWHCWMITQPQT